MRQRVTPTNPRSIAQQSVRSILAALSTSWRDTLGAEQRAAWEAYADTVSETDPLGQPVRLTGLNVYIRGNALRRQSGQAALANAPTTPGNAVFTPNLENITANDGNITIPYAAGDSFASAAGGSILLYVSDPISQARNYPTSTRLIIATNRLNVAPANPIVIDISPELNWVEGERRFLRIATVGPDARISQAVTLPLTMTAS